MENNIEWTVFYQEFAKKLLEYKDKRSELVKLVEDVFSDIQLPLPTLENVNDIKDIDPFTIFALFNKQGSKQEVKVKIIGAFSNRLEISPNITPNSFKGIPLIPQMTAAFYNKKSAKNDINLLWDLYTSALLFSSDSSQENKKKFISIFDKVMNINGIGTSKLTMALYWISPKVFLSLDSKNQSYLYKSNLLPQVFVSSLPPLKNKEKEHVSAEKYLQITECCKNAILAKQIGFDNFISLTAKTYEESDTENKKQGLKKQNDEDQCDLDKNIILFGPPGTGKTYNSIIYAVAICENKNIEDVRKDDYSEVFKRYQELCKEDRIAFTTFHQSYGYEEFIEGLKPNIEDGSADVTYEKKSGIFKAFCEKAGNKKLLSNNLKIKENPTVWKISLEGAGDNETKKDCFENDRIRMGWTNLDKHVTEDSKIDSSVVRRILNDFEYSMEVGDLVVVLKDQRSIDAIGVIDGPYEWLQNYDSYPRSRKVNWLAKNINEDIYSLNHNKVLVQQIVYRLNVDADEILKLAHKNNPSLDITVKEESEPYVFIIDEINRGNISKIFGELITLIEPSKRIGAKESTKVILPYSQIPFGVPNNVYIIGTMNTADRSISLMDTALRRRFSFIEMLPDENLLEGLKIGDIDVKKMLRTINERIECLFDREHTIGHSFFMELKDNPTISKLSDIFKKSVIPLLQEYFYEDYSKIMLVLGDNCKSKEAYQFIKKVSVDAKKIFKSYDSEIDLPDFTYEINKVAFNNIESYKGIYETVELTDNKQ